MGVCRVGIQRLKHQAVQRLCGGLPVGQCSRRRLRVLKVSRGWSAQSWGGGPPLPSIPEALLCAWPWANKEAWFLSHKEPCPSHQPVADAHPMHT